MKICPRCGTEKKGNQGIFCQPCATHFCSIKRNAKDPKFMNGKCVRRNLNISSKMRNKPVTLAPIGNK
jgi:hypothetical protein